MRHVAHEMRTLLNNSSLGLKLLEEEVLRRKNSRQLQMVEDIRRSCDSAVLTLNDLLVLDKLQAGILAMEFENIFPLKFVEDVVRPFRIQASNVLLFDNSGYT